MREEFKFPKVDIGEKLITEFQGKEFVKLTCQDWEYTSSKLEDLGKYVERYKQNLTTSEEKRVLSAFIFQACEDVLSKNYSENEHYVRQNLSTLSKDFEVTKFEFDYWSCWDMDEKENRFHISEIAREFNIRLD